MIGPPELRYAASGKPEEIGSSVNSKRQQLPEVERRGESL
jgi:hypothetical protein